jgi:hypothetical protein
VHNKCITSIYTLNFSQKYHRVVHIMYVSLPMPCMSEAIFRFVFETSFEAVKSRPCPCVMGEIELKMNRTWSYCSCRCLDTTCACSPHLFLFSFSIKQWPLTLAFINQDSLSHILVTSLSLIIVMGIRQT